MIENVEELGPELSGQAVLELPALCHRQIPVVIRQASEHITAERAIASVRRGNENGTARRVTTQVRERCHTQWPCGAGLRQTIRIADAGEVRNSAVAAVGIDQRLGGLEVNRISEEIPSFAIGILGTHLTSSAEICSRVVDTPGQAALHRDDRIQRPALQDLSRRPDAGNGVGQRIREPMGDIELARSVEVSGVIAIDRIPEPPIIRRHRQCMSVRVPKNEGQPMRSPLGHGHL